MDWGVLRDQKWWIEYRHSKDSNWKIYYESFAETLTHFAFWNAKALSLLPKIKTLSKSILEIKLNKLFKTQIIHSIHPAIDNEIKTTIFKRYTNIPQRHVNKIHKEKLSIIVLLSKNKHHNHKILSSRNFYFWASTRIPFPSNFLRKCKVNRLKWTISRF